MDSERFKHLRDLVGYDNVRLSQMLNIDASDVTDFCLGKKPVPDKVAKELELFADWSNEVGDTTTKKQLAKEHLSGR